MYITEPLVSTTVLKVFFGARETYTTLVNTQGMTTKTDFVITTKTINNNSGGLGAANLPALAQAIMPSYTLVTEPVTRWATRATKILSFVLSLHTINSQYPNSFMKTLMGMSYSIESW